ncbi:hypothetical protein LSH36_292g03027 [Paralvinella palmiformis]|uniref:PRA1 family protein n=1 Tax=Paralvinella palmiformis TaxID=53620 RepID=A0AAD9JIH1_9ANNE|nr:hypothetical protein LSH36_292g03027 [Paralvinella palmiformis]
MIPHVRPNQSFHFVMVKPRKVYHFVVPPATSAIGSNLQCNFVQRWPNGDKPIGWSNVGSMATSQLFMLLLRESVANLNLLMLILTTSSWMALTLNYIQARDWLQKQRESVQPWSEFINTNKFKLPKSVAPIGRRLIKNIDRFQSNYLFVFMGLILFCVLTSPMLLVGIAACLGACYIISVKNKDSKVILLGKEISLAHQYTAVGVLSFPLFWLAGAGSAVFWVIGASFFVIMLHASMYSIDEEVQPFELTMEEV